MNTASLALMTVFYVVAGVLHFTHTEFYLKLMPPQLPAPLALVYISGVIEVALGVLLLVPATRGAAAWGIIALLVAVFPANVYAATQGVAGAGGYVRLPFQAVLIAWAWWHTRN